MLQTIFSKHQKGEMTLEQAKQLGADLLRTGYYLPTRSSKQGKIHICPPPAEALDSLLIAMDGGQETLWI